MPKYTPTNDDMYETARCFICGDYVLEEGAETCGSWMCLQQMEMFREDLRKDLLENALRGLDQ